MPTLGVIFPGQGSQTAGMGIDAARAFPQARDCFDRASAVIGYDLFATCETGSEEALRDTRISQPAIFTANVAIYRAVESLGWTPIVSAGHSFGEYCSLTIANAMTFEQAVELVNERAAAMGAAADQAPGSMAAIIGFDREQVDEICATARTETGTRVDLANLNAPMQIVVSGDTAGVERAADLSRKAGAKRVVMLNVSGAWHSELMEPAVERFARHVETAQIRMPDFAVIGNVEAVEYTSIPEIRRCLIASLCSRVRWHETAQAVADRHPDIIVECGATRVLAPMMARLPDVEPARVIHVADASGLSRLRGLGDYAA
jgi:[acyl-carrier-protein] S-malonyltransferase